eukprot:scaffold99578_cov57-Phaeocystis_antarctica.AAC.2
MATPPMAILTMAPACAKGEEYDRHWWRPSRGGGGLGRLSLSAAILPRYVAGVVRVSAADRYLVRVRVGVGVRVRAGVRVRVSVAAADRYQRRLGALARALTCTQLA